MQGPNRLDTWIRRTFDLRFPEKQEEEFRYQFTWDGLRIVHLMLVVFIMILPVFYLVRESRNIETNPGLLFFVFIPLLFLIRFHPCRLGATRRA